ncbi:MAG TPA: Hsp20/alpha crystallin family protein [Gaiellaceae bacterium]|nr:Hsp20/alpha crystallin family protein [Gaiellaceae bacterium]
MRKSDVDRLQREFEQLFSDMWQVPGFAGLRRGFRPHVDYYRTDDPPAVTLVVDLAGVDPENVEIAVTEREIVVSGERRRPVAGCRVSYRQMEIDYGPFQRHITLAEEVDPAHAEARYEQGLLTIVMPLSERARSGKVSIAIGGKR